MKKPDLKALWKRPGRRKFFLALGAAVILLAGGAIWYSIGHTSSDPVYVYDFSLVGMTEYWGDTRECNGPVSTDRIQTVFLSNTQEVTEILVKQGDTVRKGDLLMTFDTTLSDLAVERKRLEVEKLKLDLEDAEMRLMDINNMVPMEEPDWDNPIYNGNTLTLPFRLYGDEFHDGTSEDSALICWMLDGLALDNSVLDWICQTAVVYRGYTSEYPKKEEASASAYPDEELVSSETGESLDEGQELSEADLWFLSGYASGFADGQTADYGSGYAAGQSAGYASGYADGSSESYQNGYDMGFHAGILAAQSADPVVPEEPKRPAPGRTVDDLYLIVKITDQNKSLRDYIAWEGLHIARREDASGGYANYAIAFFDAEYMEDYSCSTERDLLPDLDMGSGVTASDIASMRTQQKKTIKDLENKLKMTEAEYKIMVAELLDGNIYAQTDGRVVSLLTEEEAKETNQPILKVTDGGGYYVEGSVSELELDDLQIGQEVTVNDWESGSTYTGTISGVRDFPTNQNRFYGEGNPNASQFPFTVFVDDSADLRAGAYVSIQYSAASSDGVYLENPFIRKEKGETYVLVLGADGRLEKRTVRTGKTLWGSYIEIQEGLTAEDKIAFPYGKNVKPGAKAQEGDYSTLYSY